MFAWKQPTNSIRHFIQAWREYNAQATAIVLEAASHRQETKEPQSKKHKDGQGHAGGATTAVTGEETDGDGHAVGSSRVWGSSASRSGAEWPPTRCHRPYHPRSLRYRCCACTAVRALKLDDETAILIMLGQYTWVEGRVRADVSRSRITYGISLVGDDTIADAGKSHNSPVCLKECWVMPRLTRTRERPQSLEK